MLKKNNSPEKPQATTKKQFRWWKKVLTTIALATTLTTCDKVPRNQIILNPKENTEQFSFEYHVWWSRDPDVIDHNITVYKDWNVYKCLINKKEWWFSTNITIESNSVDGLFEEIKNKSDNEDITDDTKDRRDKKIEYAKKVFIEKVLNAEDKTHTWEIKIKYEPKK